jgi:hypothetical protein
MCPDDTVLAEARAQEECIPVTELTEQPDTDGEDEPEYPPQVAKKFHRPIYTNHYWPSPLAKVFVQKIRGNNAWDRTRWHRVSAWSLEFKSRWIQAGNTEYKLTHDNCMRYLAYRMGDLTPEQLMEKTPMEVHAKLIGEYSGVPGYYIKRY